MKFTSAKLLKFMLVVALVIPTLLVLPPQAGAYSLLTTISSTDLAEPGGVVPSLSRPLGVAVNPANGHVFVANNDCQNFCTISVFADNGAATSASSAYLMSNTVAPRDLAFNISTNHLWVTTDANTVLVLSDGVSGLDGVSQFSLSGFKPNGIAINPATGHVFVTSTDTDGHSAIWVFVDGAT
ncbi:MAG TPA: hypothetical protein VHA53_05240, partial [Nitrolancea sp.]|nr:hypothetical protein [Nitrolancea sp.]